MCVGGGSHIKNFQPEMSRKDFTLPTVHVGDLCLYYDLFSMLA